MSDVLGSIASYFNTRLKTPFYGLLGFWLVMLNWEFFYTLLFVSEDKIYDKTHLLKNEYLTNHFYHFNDPNWWLVLAGKLALAILLTYAMIWIIPRYVLLRAFREQKQHDYEKRKIKLSLEQSEVKEKTALEQASVKQLKATQEKTEIEKDIQKTDPSVLWEQEYEEFEKSQLSQDFDQLVDTLYSHNGKTRVVATTTSPAFELNRDLLAYADANSLIEYDRSKDVISLTKKGKFFVKKYQSSLG